MIDFVQLFKLTADDIGQVLGISKNTAQKVKYNALHKTLSKKYSFLENKNNEEVRRDIEPFPIKKIRDVEKKLFEMIEKDPTNPMIEELRLEYEKFKWSNW